MGGTSQAIRTCIKGLSALGDKNEVVTLDPPDAAFLGCDPFPIYALGAFKNPWSFSPTLIPWLVDNLPRFDAVIIHGLWLFHGFALLRAMQQVAANGSGVGNSSNPLVYVMPHGMLDPYFQKDSSRKLKAIRNNFYWKWIESHVIGKADGLLFTCEDERVLAQKTFTPYQPKKELVVGLGVDEPPAFTPKMKEAFLLTCPLPADSSYLLFLSRLHPKKGLEELIRAYAASSHLALPPLVIAGPHDSPYAEEMVELARRLCPPNSVFFPGMLTGDAKWGAFYGSEIFILPSHQENFGIAIVEAMACGKPVMITRKVNIWQEIAVENGGLIFSDTHEQICDMLEQWQQIPAHKRAEMEQGARLAYQKNFTIDASARRLQQALAKKQATACDSKLPAFSSCH